MTKPAEDRVTGEFNPAGRLSNVTGRWEYLGWQSVAKLAWFKSGLQLRGGWGRRPKGNAPRSEASALGARWLLPAQSQPPNYRHLRGWQKESSRPTPHAPRPTPHALMTLGANHVSRATEMG